MATIRSITHAPLQIHVKHSEADATYSIVRDIDGTKYLQIDTYGSRDRKLKDKKSQSLRLSAEVLATLRTLIDEHFFPR